MVIHVPITPGGSHPRACPSHTSALLRNCLHYVTAGVMDLASDEPLPGVPSTWALSGSVPEVGARPRLAYWLHCGSLAQGQLWHGTGVAAACFATLAHRTLSARSPLGT